VHIFDLGTDCDVSWNMALADAAVVVSQDPNNTKAWIRLGKALRALGKIDESIKGGRAFVFSIFCQSK
jgi:hypothetical protein